MQESKQFLLMFIFSNEMSHDFSRKEFQLDIKRDK